ncbi:MAG: CotH kinase family protein [Lewinellaceae bacterium]|nr:CotH kinase family protein [Lewinellaceae bacterium]
MTRLLPALILCFFTHTLTAQVLINEVSAANMNGITDTDGDREDWLELYNSGPATVNLGGWFLSDNPNKPQKWVIPNGQSIPAGGYRLVFCSGKDKIAGISMHTSFKITQTQGESVVLTQPNGTTADIYTFTIPNQLNHSYGRVPNGAATWRIFSTPTPGGSNTTIPFQGYAPDVQTSLDAGFYPGAIQVSLSTDPGYDIRYTTNGAEPVPASALYTGPVNIAATTVLKARAFSLTGQELPGFVTANTYFINVSHTIPVVSISSDNLNTLMSGSQIRPYGAFEYFENNALIDEGYGEFNKHGNDSWAYPQRGIDWITRDQMGYTDELKHKFFKERSRKKFQRLILKAAANDNYPSSNGGAHIRDSYVHTLALNAGMDLDVRTHRSAILYVNGQYWGVYDIREKVDDSDFTAYYYDQDEPYIDYIKTWGGTWNEYGSSTDWYTLKAFILGNNMANQANYDYVQQQFDLLSLIDYVIINQHSVCKDWLNWNTSWWRGRDPNGDAKRWRYTLWDMDATFGHYINYTGIPNTGPNADPCDVELIPNNGDPQNHIDIFMALYNNPDFKAMYINRYADLLNTYLSCDYMNALLDSMINVIAPEMQQHCMRWGGSTGQWFQNVNAMHDFINTRCQILDQSIVGCYDVTGPYDLTVKISPAASPNHVMVNTITPPVYPFVGEYFGGVNIDLVAKPAPGWIFDHWEVSGNTFGPDQTSDAILLAFQTSGMVTAFFIPLGPCTEPTGITVSNTPTALDVDWVAQQFASGYLIRYRETGTTPWTFVTTDQNTWNFDTLPGCSNYEAQIQSVCPLDSSDFVDFTFDTPDLLLGFDVPDAVICNSDLAVLDATFPGAAYQWDNGSSAPTRNVNAPGKYWVTADLNGCSLTDTIQVSQINATTSIQPLLCPGETYLVGSETFDAQNPSGQVNLGGIAASGCDSIVNVSLQYLNTSQTQLNVTSCDPASVGVDTVVLTNAVGCDSVVIITTVLAPFSQTTFTASSCNPAEIGVDTVILISQFGCDSLVITTTNFDPSMIPVTSLFTTNCDPASVGVDTLILASAAGCDSLIITTTTLAPYSETFLMASSCNPAQAGTDTVILVNQYGCDSLVITSTAFDPSAIPVTSLFAMNCDPASVGVDTVVLNSAAGCDSLVITTTTLAPYSETLLSATSCNPAMVGVDTVILSNQYGCDSLVITTTYFDLVGISVTTLFATNCDPASVGVDTVLLTNVAGCDSLVITTTTLAPFSQSFLAAVSCNPALAGVDTVVLVNQYGCDSLVITTTSFDPSIIPVTSLFATNCDPASVGVDTVIMNSAAGCDSVVITTTTLVPSSETFLTATSCDFAQAGVDTVVLSNQYGCDSLVITTVDYTGLDFAASVQDVFCFGGKDGAIRLDTALTPWLPVEFVLENRPAQAYTGAPLVWNDLSAGVYSLVATNSEGCTLVQDIDVGPGNMLHLDFTQQPLELHLGDSAWVNPVADFQIALAEWSPRDGVRCPDCAATYLAPLNTNLYTLTASDANGCQTSATLRVLVDQGVRIYLGNAIRPGSGGANADLAISAGPEVLRILTLQLYDRWGNKIFEQKDLAPNMPSTWDGKFNGKLVGPGVLIWVCELETVDGRVLTESGDITVLR